MSVKQQCVAFMSRGHLRTSHTHQRLEVCRTRRGWVGAPCCWTTWRGADRTLRGVHFPGRSAWRPWSPGSRSPTNRDRNEVKTVTSGFGEIQRIFGLQFGLWAAKMCLRGAAEFVFITLCVAVKPASLHTSLMTTVDRVVRLMHTAVSHPQNTL